MVESINRPEPLVPASQVKLMPYFQGKNSNRVHPAWARDLKVLENLEDKTYRSSFAKYLEKDAL